jgi:hypothetical protein
VLRADVRSFNIRRGWLRFAALQPRRQNSDARFDFLPTPYFRVGEWFGWDSS